MPDNQNMRQWIYKKAFARQKVFIKAFAQQKVFLYFK
jgi:hypothetical protein